MLISLTTNTPAYRIYMSNMYSVVKEWEAIVYWLCITRCSVDISILFCWTNCFIGILLSSFNTTTKERLTKMINQNIINIPAFVQQLHIYQLVILHYAWGLPLLCFPAAIYFCTFDSNAHTMFSSSWVLNFIVYYKHKSLKFLAFLYSSMHILYI